MTESHTASSKRDIFLLLGYCSVAIGHISVGVALFADTLGVDAVGGWCILIALLLALVALATVYVSRPWMLRAACAAAVLGYLFCLMCVFTHQGREYYALFFIPVASIIALLFCFLACWLTTKKTKRPVAVDVGGASFGKKLAALIILFVLPLPTAWAIHLIPPSLTLTNSNVLYNRTTQSGESGIYIGFDVDSFAPSSPYRWWLNAHLISRRGEALDKWPLADYPRHARFYRDGVSKFRDNIAFDFASPGGFFFLPYRLLETGEKQFAQGLERYDPKSVSALVASNRDIRFAVEVELVTNRNDTVSKKTLAIFPLNRYASDVPGGFEQSKWSALLGGSAQRLAGAAVSEKIEQKSEKIEQKIEHTAHSASHTWKVIELLSSDSLRVERKPGDNPLNSQEVEIYFMIEGMNVKARRATGRINRVEQRDFYVAINRSTQTGKPTVGDFVAIVSGQ